MYGIEIPHQNQHTPGDYSQKAEYGFNQQADMFRQNFPHLEYSHQPIIFDGNANRNAVHPVTNFLQNPIGPAQPPITGSKLVDASLTSRIGFIRKVYILLAIQLLITTLICTASVQTTYEGGFGFFQLNNLWLLWMSLAMHLTFIIVIKCYTKLARRVPLNYFLLFLFTLIEAYLVSAICAIYSQNGATSWLIISAGMTAGVTTSVTAYAFFSKTDITQNLWQGMVWACPSIFLLLCISIWACNFTVLSSLCNALYALLYCFFLLYDSQKIAGGTKHQLEVDDYVLGVILLYSDIVMIFLSMLGQQRRRWRSRRR